MPMTRITRVSAGVLLAALLLVWSSETILIWEARPADYYQPRGAPNLQVIDRYTAVGVALLAGSGPERSLWRALYPYRLADPLSSARRLNDQLIAALPVETPGQFVARRGAIANLVVILGESGDLHRLEQLFGEIEGTPILGLIERAYVPDQLPHRRLGTDSAMPTAWIMREVPTESGRTLLNEKLAQHDGDPEAAKAAREHLIGLGRGLASRMAFLRLSLLTLVTLAAVALWRNHHPVRVHKFPTWSPSSGLIGFLICALAALLAPLALAPLAPYIGKPLWSATSALVVLAITVAVVCFVGREQHDRLLTRFFRGTLTPSGLVSAGVLLFFAERTFGFFYYIARESWVSAIDRADWPDWIAMYQSPLEALATVAKFSIIGPVTEELVFRGLLFTTLRCGMGLGFWSAALLSSGVFSLLHVGASLMHVPFLMLLGMLTAWGYEWTKSLLPGIICHSLINLWPIMESLALLR